MSKYVLNFENIPKGIVTKKYSNLLTPSAPAKVQLEWLRNYLRPFAAQSQKPAQSIKPNLSKKNTTRRLLKTKNRTITNNQNRNEMNLVNFGIVSNHTIVRKMEDSDLLDAYNEHRRRNSCQMLRNNKKQSKFRLSRQSLPKRQKQPAHHQITTLQPWQSEDLTPKTQQIDGDIVGYMFNHHK